MVVFLLTLVRHGETIANKTQVIQGHQDTSLSDEGVKQAQMVAQRFQNNKFTHIFASDLKRAALTAQAIAKANHCARYTVQLDTRLRERTFGVFEGRTFQDLHAASKESKMDTWQSFLPEGAESYEQVRLRAKEFFQDLCQLITEKSGESSGGKDTLPPVHTDKIHCPKSSALHCGLDQYQSSPLVEEKSNTLVQTGVTDQGSNTLPQTQTSCPSQIEFPETNSSGASSIPSPLQKLGSAVGMPQDLADSRKTFNTPILSTCVVESYENLSAVKNVLIVSHGGLITELVVHFIEDLGCEIPGGRRKAMETSPNTGVSCFCITVEDQKTKPIVKCLMIHNNDHLFQEPLKEPRPAI